jgi:uncharacterized protein YdeI (YjbR/CyaY-like superfamily)
MKDLEFIYFRSRNELREWLQKHYDTSPGLWMVYFKKHTEEECIKYDEALEEALCFGWIDSLIKRIDEDRYARKFTPRTNTKKWSEINKKKVAELIKSGRMTSAGLMKTDGFALIGNADYSTKPAEKKSQDIPPPDFILEKFAQNEPALINFQKLPPSCRRQYVLWIMNAKREVTIKKRISEAIVLLKENKKLGLK